MNIKPIRSEDDYRAALEEVESLMTAGPDSPQDERLDVLVTLVEAWERKRHSLDLPDPIEAIRFAMEQQDLTPRDLEPMLGVPATVQAVLSRRMPLTLKMIWNLHRVLGIPAESLIRQPDDSQAA